jgi:hypothetical protein
LEEGETPHIQNTKTQNYKKMLKQNRT